MATIPSTLIIMLEDKINFSMKMSLVVMKQIFRYGVKEIVQKDDKIFIALTYSPKSSTLLRKFGNLPIKYIRTKLETDEELMVFEKAIKRYHFDLNDIDEQDQIEGGGERLEIQEPTRKRKRMSPKTISALPSPCSSSDSSHFIPSAYQHDEDFIESQRF
ncbi:hypothetical protein NQ314_021277 [Rhamnusium bicolor]|uniref:Uncharacterized protein n=1 Tax=Rhamnusium bicolor TaxID=1586634 RepID=A0AAV8WI36_9CUCU|nr:hypothetical protein NQ314_021277 [Rhamnusium bicolor]